MPFNGLAQKSIIEVIPGHLRRIEALLSGQPERFYDLNAGKWTNGKSIADSFKNIKKNNVSTAFSDVAEEMVDMMKALSFKTREDKESFIKDMQSFFESVYDNGGYFNPNSKDSSRHIRYGVGSQANMKMIESMYKNLRRGTTMSVAGNVAYQRDRQNQYME